MHTIRVITRLAWNSRRTDRASASISCEHCRSSRYDTHYAPRHLIYYYKIYKTYNHTFYVPQARKLVFPLQLRVTECCVFRYRGIQCKNWTAHVHYSLTAESNQFLTLLLLTSSSYSVSTDYYTRPIKSKCSQDWSRLGFVSALSGLRLDFDLLLALSLVTQSPSLCA